MIKKDTLFLLSFVIFLAACTGIDNGKDEKKRSVYFDYRVWGDEESGDMTVRLQYRFAGPGGSSLILKDPGKVEMDGKGLRLDSSKMNGAWYEVTEPVEEFTGDHVIVFTDIDTKEYKEEFSFRPFALLTNVPPVIARADLIFELTGVDSTDYIKVLMTDTASFSEGIVRLDTVINGRITITKEQLTALTSGPIHFELFKDEDKRIKDGTVRGGKLSISYALKREFELID